MCNRRQIDSQNIFPQRLNTFVDSSNISQQQDSDPGERAEMHEAAATAILAMQGTLIVHLVW